MRWLCLFWVLVGALGCASGRGAEGSKAGPPPRIEGVAFALRLVTPDDYRVKSDMEQLTMLLKDELDKAGYRIVEPRAADRESNAPDAERAESPDAEIVCQMIVGEHDGIIKWVKDGKTLGGFRVDLSLSVSYGKSRVRQEASFRFTQGSILERRQYVEDLVHRFRRDSEMRTITGEIITARRSRQALERDEAVRERGRIESAWRVSHLEPCARPQRATDCDALEQWLGAAAKDPPGSESMVEEGDRTLAQARPLIAGLRDDAAWLEAGSRDCIAMATDEACAGVTAYLTTFGQGKYASEAHAALDAMHEKAARDREEAVAENRRQRAAAAETTRKQNEAAAARAKQQEQATARRQCVEGCLQKCARHLEQAAFEQCKSACLPSCG